MGWRIFFYLYPTQCQENRQQVSLHFDATPTGEDVVVFAGLAQFDQSAPLAHKNIPYLEKYLAGIKALGLTLEEMGNGYNVCIRVQPIKVRGW